MNSEEKALVQAYAEARKHAGEAGGVAVAHRYSGDVAVTLIYRDALNDYACKVTSADGTRIVFVGNPACLEHAVDSREAFDSAARAAIRFAEDEGLDVNPEWQPPEELIRVRGKRGKGVGRVS